MKIKNGQVFQTTGEAWSVWIPEGETIKIYISPDGVSDHFSQIGEESKITGPNVFQCMGYNQRSFFKITGLSSKNKYLEILV